jgi:NADH-quinone oxidoreductase subunit K
LVLHGDSGWVRLRHRSTDVGIHPKKEEEVLILMVPTSAYLILAAVLFSIGVAAFLIKRNLITIFMSIELMLNAVNLTFVAFAHMWHQVSGQIFVFFVMVVAAAEAAVGLAIIISIFRTRETLNVDQVDLMKS